MHFAFLRTSVWLCPVVASYLSQPFEMTGGTGSYTFMAGEIFRHEPYNTKADMYSFAMICYHMLTGARPFTGLDPVSAAMRASIDGLRPEWPAAPMHYSAEDCAALGKVQGLVERCWSSSPMDRCAPLRPQGKRAGIFDTDKIFDTCTHACMQADFSGGDC